MKIKEVQAGVKVSRNYNSYSISLTADVEEDEIPEKVGEELIKKASKVIYENIKEDKIEMIKKNSNVEVGAAWIHKKSINFLSVKFSNGKWEDIRISDLDETSDGYKWISNEGVLVLKRIPEEKRKSNKMPMFRIYRSENE